MKKNGKARPEAGREKMDFERSGREKLIAREAAEDTDGILDLSLRPTKISEFIGQENLKENVHVALEAAKKRKEPLEHILLSGPPGLGKTTLAHIMAHEMKAKITATSGPAIERAGDLIGILTNLEDGDILFIDEIHRLTKVVEEFIYPAMEDFSIDFVVDKGPYAKTIKFTLKRFTLIGATTRSGLISSPLRGRFGITFHLDFYSPEDLARIIGRSAKLLSIDIDGAAALELATRSRGTPRIANRLLRRVRDYATVKGVGAIKRETIGKALESHGIDASGLDNLDRKVLLTILEVYNGGPVGIESLAATLNEEVDTIVDVVEPFLLKNGYLKRTSRGREATQKAERHLSLSGKTRSKDLF